MYAYVITLGFGVVSEKYAAGVGQCEWKRSNPLAIRYASAALRTSYSRSWYEVADGSSWVARGTTA